MAKYITLRNPKYKIDLRAGEKSELIKLESEYSEIELINKIIDRLKANDVDFDIKAKNSKQLHLLVFGNDDINFTKRLIKEYW